MEVTEEIATQAKYYVAYNRVNGLCDLRINSPISTFSNPAIPPRDLAPHLSSLRQGLEDVVGYAQEQITAIKEQYGDASTRSSIDDIMAAIGWRLNELLAAQKERAITRQAQVIERIEALSSDVQEASGQEGVGRTSQTRQ